MLKTNPHHKKRLEYEIYLTNNLSIRVPTFFKSGICPIRTSNGNEGSKCSFYFVNYISVVLQEPR